MVITATPHPDKLELLQSYLGQALPVLIGGGEKPVGRFRAKEQLLGDSGPMFTAILEYSDARAIKDVLASDAFNALGELRAEVFQSINILECASL